MANSKLAIKIILSKLELEELCRVRNQAYKELNEAVERLNELSNELVDCQEQVVKLHPTLSARRFQEGIKPLMQAARETKSKMLALDEVHACACDYIEDYYEEKDEEDF